MIPGIGEIVIGCFVIGLLCEICGALKSLWEFTGLHKYRKAVISAVMAVIICSVVWVSDDMQDISNGQRVLMFLAMFGCIWLVADGVEKRAKGE
jgi:FtsH-binding integral membrane protein